MKIKNHKKRRGISMIELLMVLVIMGTIIAILISSLTKTQGRAEGKLSKLKMQMDWAKINTALLDYQRTYGTYPDANTGLEALVNPPSTDDGQSPASFIDRDSILDQWKRPYHLELTDSGYRVLTLGADGATGGEGINADVDLASVR